MLINVTTERDIYPKYDKITSVESLLNNVELYLVCYSSESVFNFDEYRSPSRAIPGQLELVILHTNLKALGLVAETLVTIVTK
ncbi:hypothetical protein TNCV_4602631 [Trichonephila clavipes]|nr:hypothetical protein TNCV_4602631 [Trichonephila clavipes]